MSPVPSLHRGNGLNQKMGNLKSTIMKLSLPRDTGLNLIRSAKYLRFKLLQDWGESAASQRTTRGKYIWK